MFLGEKELITHRDRTSLLRLRISAALPVGLGCNFAFDVLFSFLHLFFSRFAAVVAVEVRLAVVTAGFGENDGGGEVAK
jgi:hypothetical protein